MEVLPSIVWGCAGLVVVVIILIVIHAVWGDLLE
jgi:hypothetical protein